jgi:hypothetical protein
MAVRVPAIIWRNPKAVYRRRVWNQARRDSKCRLYVVVRSGIGNNCEWEGLPNLEMIEGGASARARKAATGTTRSRG